MNFSTLIKPASSGCNLHCKYCFYADVSNSRQVKSHGIMSKDTAHSLIDRSAEFADGGRVDFSFQGGEPTLAGIEFFKDFCEYAKQKNIKPVYSIQTNGIVLNNDWCELFKTYDFLVGLSLDGNKANHDFLRLYPNGEGTFNDVLKACELMKIHKVDFNILSVLTKGMARHPQKTFAFFIKQGFKYIQFIPCLAPLDGSSGGEFALSPTDYAEFLKQIAKLWFNELTQNKNYISIRMFDNILLILKGQPPEQCGMGGQCSFQFVTEADGSVYPCDFYVLDEFNSGNINNSSIEQILSCDPAKEFMKLREIPSQCQSCDTFAVCHSGCKRYYDLYFKKYNYCPYNDFIKSTYQYFKTALKYL